MIITKTEGYFIVNGGLFILNDGSNLSYNSETSVQEFETEAEAIDAHILQFPDYHTEQGQQEIL